MMRLTMLSILGKKNMLAWKKPLWWLGGLLSSTVGLLFYAATLNSIEHDSRGRFQHLAHTAQHNLGARIKSYADLLRGTASLFSATDGVSRDQFHRYVTNLALERHFPAILNINYSHFLTEEQRPAFEAALARDYPPGRDGYPRFAITPEGRRDSYSVLLYIEPIASAPEKFGVDIAIRPAIAEVLANSRDSGLLSNSGRPVPLDRRPGVKGMAMRIPIYRNGMPTASLAQRRSAYQGSVGVGFDMAALVRGVLDEMPVRKVRVTLFDTGDNPDPAAVIAVEQPVLFDSAPPDVAAPWWRARESDDYLSTVLPINYNGRIWQAHFGAKKSELYTRFDAYAPWLAMLAGFVSTMLLYALFQTLSTSRRRAIQMAKSMTQELRDSQIKLQISHQKLRRLAAHADQIKEEERTRIAREIHDDLGQNLLVLRIDADMLASRTQHRHPRLNTRARATLGQIDTTIKSVRHIINDLRPTVLDLGVNAAVEWQIADFRRRTGIACELIESHAEIKLSDHCATAFFRILQESLSNISQHARASLVQVELQKDEDRLSMTVRDNGVGLRADGGNKAGSFGLVGIEERIKILGGQFSIQSSPGAGMTVYVSVPIKADATAYPYLGEAFEHDEEPVSY